MVLLRGLKKKAANDDEYVVRLEQLIDEFLRGKRTVDKEIAGTFQALNPILAG